MSSSLTTLRVLEIVGDRQPVAVADVARIIDRPKSTAQRALQTLHEAGWIRPDGSERTRWCLSTKAASVARRVASEHGLRDAAEAVLGRLRDTTLESVSLAVLEGDETVTIDFWEGRHTLRLVPPVGVRLPLHAGGSGKVILAHLPEPTRKRVVHGPLEALTVNTVTSKRRLLAELDQIRAKGYAVSREEVTEGAAGVAVVVRRPDGFPVASVSLLLPTSRADEKHIEQLAVDVCGAAEEIERAMRHS